MPRIVILFIQISPIFERFPKNHACVYKCSNVPAAYVYTTLEFAKFGEQNYKIIVQTGMHKAVPTRVPCMHFTPITGSTQWVYT